MSLIAAWRGRRLAPRINELQQWYAQPRARSERLAWQLERFNACWHGIRATVPFYRDLACRRGLPQHFETWEQVIESLPALDRTTIQTEGIRLASELRAPDFWRTTGGSTAQPVRVPAWNDEREHTTPSQWLARSWYGVRAEDRLFLLWGHSHLFGTGLRGLLNRRLREAKDRALGYRRWSAYDIGAAAMERAGQDLLSFRPQYVIGYSVALDAFCRANRRPSAEFHQLGLKVVIAAAEGFPSPDSQALISEVLGAPVAMEYGSVECDLVAHTTPAGPYGAFWRTYFLEAREAGEGGRREVLVTSLYPRCFPLVRYRLGDELELMDEDADGLGVTRFARVAGRCNDYLELGDGSRVHSELITHTIRDVRGIRTYQAVQAGERITILLVPAGRLPEGAVPQVKSRLARINPMLTAASVEPAQALRRTVAGKTPMVIREKT